MDETLSKFVDKTGCDPSFARDLLEGKQWNFDEALKAFQEFSLGASNETSPQQRKNLTKPQRGISVVNSEIVQKARIKVLTRDGHVTDENEGFEEMARFTFVLPDLSSYNADFADFLREDLIESSALVALEQSGHLNWWSDIGICHRLVPLATVGDGNCLLHAASLGMWGFHDRLLTLRKALLSTLISDSASGGIKRRWRLQQHQRNMEAGGLVYTDEEWEKEWEEVLRLASTSRKKLNNRPKLDKGLSLPSIDEGREKVQPVDKNEPGKEQPVDKNEPGKEQPVDKNEPGKVEPVDKNEPGKEQPVDKNKPGKEQPVDKNEPGKEQPVDKNEPGKEQPVDKNEPGKEQPVDKNEPGKEQPVDKNEPGKVEPVDKNEPGKVEPVDKNEPGKVEPVDKNEPGKVEPVDKNEPGKVEPVDEPGKVEPVDKNEPGKVEPVDKNEPGKVEPVDKNEPGKVEPVDKNEPGEAAKEHSPKPTPQPSSEDKEKNLNKCGDTENTKVETKITREDKKEEIKHQEENEENEGAFESLEEIHVFVLAHVLRRPIIIIADKFLRDFSGDPIAPIPFGGIYLPCECPPETCLKTPLILAFESAHFSAVVASEGKGKQESLVAAIPVVSHDYQLLTIHFPVDPGESFDWSTLDKETDLPSKLLLNAEQKLELLGKYLDIVHIKIPSSAKTAYSQGKVDAHQPQKGSQVVKEGDKGVNSWFSSQINKVGNLAGKIKGSWDSNTLCAAKLKMDQKPEYYKEMINNYIGSAKERFQERKKQEEAKKSELGSSQSGSYRCPTPGCQLYGRPDTNYLCSGCYRTQKSASEAGLYKKSNETQNEGKATFRSYLPPFSTYLDYPNSISNYYNTGVTSTRNIPVNTPKVTPPSYAQAVQSSIRDESNRCLTEGCSFYGRPDQKGFCSSCYKKKPH